MHEAEDDSFIMITVFALISVLHVFGATCNVNETVQSNIQPSKKKEYKAATFHAISSRHSLAV